MVNNFKYVLLDQSLILYRACFVVSKHKKDYTVGDVITMVIWTVNKIFRDNNFSVRKAAWAVDKWAPEGGYYTTLMLGGFYKDSRGDIDANKGKGDPLSTYMTKEKYEEIKNDPNSSQELIDAAYEKYYFNEIKRKAKRALTYEFGNFGIPSIFTPGYEADDMLYLASSFLYNDSEKSLLVTKDSDISYRLSPNVYQWKLGSSKTPGELISYDQMYNQMPQELKDAGVSLYEMKAYIDALGSTSGEFSGHNGMRQSIKARVNPIDAIIRIKGGDYSDLADPVLFQKQFSSFDISKFPRFEEATKQITEVLPKSGKLGSIEEFHKFCEKYGITEISDKYYTDFISRFDSTLYEN